MAWIKEIDRNESEILNKIYEKAEHRTGEKTANILRVHSIAPEILEIHMKLYETIMFYDGELSRFQREMIGVVVSKSNGCNYCATHHSQALFHVTQNQEQMMKILEDYKTAGLSKLDEEMCRYAEKLTLTPYRIEESDVFRLSVLAANDRMIFDINQMVAYFNYVNRIVFGLGVDLEVVGE